MSSSPSQIILFLARSLHSYGSTDEWVGSAGGKNYDPKFSWNQTIVSFVAGNLASICKLDSIVCYIKIITHG